TRAVRRRGLPDGSPPPSFAATMISRAILVKILPRWASSAPFLRLIVDHLLCPDIVTQVGTTRARRKKAPGRGQGGGRGHGGDRGRSARRGGDGAAGPRRVRGSGSF